MLTHCARRNVKRLIGSSISEVGANLPMSPTRPKLRTDCKDPIRSSNWKPGWIAERREPSFVLRSNMSTAEEFANRFQDRLSIGSSLSVFSLLFTFQNSDIPDSWGNVPAMDIVNLQNNEKDLATDLSLAFVGGWPVYTGILHLTTFQPRVIFETLSQQSMPLDQIILGN